MISKQSTSYPVQAFIQWIEVQDEPAKVQAIYVLAGHMADALWKREYRMFEALEAFERFKEAFGVSDAAARGIERYLFVAVKRGVDWCKADARS